MSDAPSQEQPFTVSAVDTETARRAVSPSPSSSAQERWLAENSSALARSNRFVEEHGLPLAQHRGPTR